MSYPQENKHNRNNVIVTQNLRDGGNLRDCIFKLRLGYENRVGHGGW